jgi:hypothetical protein
VILIAAVAAIIGPQASALVATFAMLAVVATVVLMDFESPRELRSGPRRRLIVAIGLQTIGRYDAATVSVPMQIRNRPIRVIFIISTLIRCTPHCHKNARY